MVGYKPIDDAGVCGGEGDRPVRPYGVRGDLSSCEAQSKSVSSDTCVCKPLNPIHNPYCSALRSPHSASFQLDSAVARNNWLIIVRMNPGPGMQVLIVDRQMARLVVLSARTRYLVQHLTETSVCPEVKRGVRQLQAADRQAIMIYRDFFPLPLPELSPLVTLFQSKGQFAIRPYIGNTCG